jgi:hypothetical protein
MRGILRTTATLAIAAAVATAGLLVVAGPAQADDSATVAKAKAEVTRRIDLRLDALRRFDTRLNSAKHLTGDHKSTLHDLISKDEAGLGDLKTKVADETTIAALRADAASMVNDYRVFILVGPKVRLTIVGDAEQAAIDKLRDVEKTLADLVAKAKAAGKDTAAAEQNLADMLAALDKATSDVDGQVATLLAIQPGPDGAAIRAKVASVRRALGAGRADLRAAVLEARQVRKFLKSL